MVRRFHSDINFWWYSVIDVVSPEYLVSCDIHSKICKVLLHSIGRLLEFSTILLVIRVELLIFDQFRLRNTNHNISQNPIQPIPISTYISFLYDGESSGSIRLIYFLKNQEMNKIPDVTKIIPNRNSFSTINHRNNAITPIKRWLFSFTPSRDSWRKLSISKSFDEDELGFGLLVEVLFISTAVVFLTMSRR